MSRLGQQRIFVNFAPEKVKARKAGPKDTNPANFTAWLVCLLSKIALILTVVVRENEDQGFYDTGRRLCQW